MSVPVVERSGSKGEGAKEFHWFEFFFLSLSLTKKTSLDSFKPQQTQVSMGLEKLHRVRRVLHTWMQEGKVFCFSDKTLMKSKGARSRRNGGNHIPKYLFRVLGKPVFLGIWNSLQKVGETHLSWNINILFSWKQKKKMSYHSEMNKWQRWAVAVKISQIQSYTVRDGIQLFYVASQQINHHLKFPSHNNKDDI